MLEIQSINDIDDKKYVLLPVSMLWRYLKNIF